MSESTRRVAAALDELTNCDVVAAAKGGLADSNLSRGAQIEAMPIVEANLRWAMKALRTAPTEDLTAGAPWGGRGLRQEVWDEFDEERDGMEHELRALILSESHDDIETCSGPAFGEAWSACHEIMEAAADRLFARLAAVLLLARNLH